MSLPVRQLGPFSVSALGLGCMNLSHAYDHPPAPAAATALLLRALDLGVTLFDTAALYGFGANETLVGQVLGPHRQRLTLASKCGMQGVGGQRVIDGRPETLRATCEDSLRRLRTDVIDLYYLHRWDKRVPIEDSVGALAELVRAGKVRAIGLSEVSSATLRRAHAVHPITALQSEYSLWSRDLERQTLATCRELGVTLVAFSPLARGFLGGLLKDPAALPAGDIRRAMPRFSAEAYAQNLRLLDELQPIADEVGCTVAQLALAWLLHQGPDVVPIPGTRQIAHLEEDLAAARVQLPASVLEPLDRVMDPARIVGARYNAATLTEIDAD